MATTISTDTKTIALAVLSLVASYFARLNIFPPNGQSHTKDLKEVDTIYKLRILSLTRLFSWIYPLAGLYQSFLILTYPSTPLCPHPQNLSPHLFTWTWYPVTIFTTLTVLVAIRLKAYADLGPNFTFELTAPKELITWGLYKYVQHPSYPTLIGALICSNLMWVHPHGVLGCVLSEAIANSKVFLWGLWVAVVCLLAYTMPKRVREEERLLKKEFGQSWVDYNRKTPRFIPFVV